MRCLRRLNAKFKASEQSAALNLIACSQIAEPHSLNLDLAARNGSKQIRDRRRRGREIQGLRVDFIPVLYNLARALRRGEHQCGGRFHIDFTLARLYKCGMKAAPIKFSRELLRRFRASAVKFRLAARMLFD